MKEESNGWVGSVLVIIAIWFIYVAAEAAWHSKIRYALQYGANYGDVTKDKKPHDCDWLAAPLGDKNCTYEPEVSVQTITTSTDRNSGRPIVSYDNGKTWDFNDGANPAKAGTTVYVGWQKTDE